LVFSIALKSYYMEIDFSIDDIPDVQAKGCSERITFAITPEAKQKLKALKAKGKDHAALVRMLIDKFFEKNPVDDAA
jgi:hypothetical protein